MVYIQYGCFLRLRSFFCGKSL